MQVGKRKGGMRMNIMDVFFYPYMKIEEENLLKLF
jgi:hypothetical protein